MRSLSALSDHLGLKARELAHDGLADEVGLAVRGGNHAAQPGLKENFFQALVVGFLQARGERLGFGDGLGGDLWGHGSSKKGLAARAFVIY